MKTLRTVLATFFVTALAVPLLAVNTPAAQAADERCQCFCESISTEAVSNPGSSSVPTTISATEVRGPKFDSGSVNNKDACIEQCKKIEPGTGFERVSWNSCIQADCWCKGSQGNVKNSETSKQGCIDNCAKAGQSFVSWGNTPPSPPGSTTTTACPPGGIWTPEECAAAKNNAGDPIGIWKGPAGVTSGPYCYYNDAPVKLGVALGGLSKANLAQYLTMAYQIGLGIAAILAVIFIMIGGFRYLSAAGGSGVEAGKGMIKNAIIGLVLAALSYTLLQTVNPDILSMRLPTVKLIKSCDVGPIDCGSRKDEKTCNDNSKDASKKCSWNNIQSICIDLATTQSGTPGELGGECKKETNGTYTCVTGRCVKVDSNKMICSDGGTCQTCTSDSSDDPAGPAGQCRKDGIYKVKCLSKMCAQLNPNNMPKDPNNPKEENFLLCTGSRCSSDAQCQTGKCLNNYCVVANEGSTEICTASLKEGDDCNEGKKCSKSMIKQSGGEVRGCCTNGELNGCIGCFNDRDCAVNMYCLNDSEYKFLDEGGYSVDKQFVGRCVYAGAKGAPCNSSVMCGDKMSCIGNTCN